MARREEGRLSVDLKKGFLTDWGGGGGGAVRIMRSDKKKNKSSERRKEVGDGW